MQFIAQGVGPGQPNRQPDVFVVQKLLNMNLGRLNQHRAHHLHPLDTHGRFDGPTQDLLQSYAWWVGLRESAACIPVAGPAPPAAAAAATGGAPTSPGAASSPATGGTTRQPAPPAASSLPHTAPHPQPSWLLTADAPRLNFLAEEPTPAGLGGAAGGAAPQPRPSTTTGTVPSNAAATPAAGPTAPLHPLLQSLVHGALAWQGQYLPAEGDPALRALESGAITTWPMFKALCRMRQSRALLMVLRAVAPTIDRNKRASAAELAESVALAMELADISTPLRKAAFLAQVATESDGFKALREYASGQAYEGRADLGNVLKGDGVRFAGRGFIQLTGRENYSRAWKKLGLPMLRNEALATAPKGAYSWKTDHLEPHDPAYAETLEGAARVTAWFWNRHELNALCDKLGKVGNQDKVFLRLSIAINGKNKKTGLPNGWDHRKRYFKAAKHALGII